MSSLSDSIRSTEKDYKLKLDSLRERKADVTVDKASEPGHNQKRVSESALHQDWQTDTAKFIQDTATEFNKEDIHTVVKDLDNTNETDARASAVETTIENDVSHVSSSQAVPVESSTPLQRPVPTPVAEHQPRVQIGQIDIIVQAPAVQANTGQTQQSDAQLLARRYLRRI
jgi:hypothetical protein